MAGRDKSVVNFEPFRMDHLAAIFFEIVPLPCDHDFHVWICAADRRLGLNKVFEAFVVPNPTKEQNCVAVVRVRCRTCRGANCHMRNYMHTVGRNTKQFDNLPSQAPRRAR